MAKTKHQKLADMMKSMFDAIEEHNQKVAKQLNLVQLHFYEPYILLGRPLMKKSALREMFVTHYLSLQSFAQDPTLRSICQELPMLGTVITPPVHLLSESRQATGKGVWVAPWRVRIVLPEENRCKYERSRLQAILYCPRHDEISYEIDWFERDMAMDSLSHQLLSSMEVERRKDVVRNNLLKDPFPVWEQAKAKWLAPLTEESDLDFVYELPANPRNVDDIDFAPRKGQTIALAYEAVLKSIRARQYRHRQPLRKLYKRGLEEEMFENVPWTDKEKKAFLHEWQDNFFEKELSAAPKKTGRWEQCEGVDDVTASLFIEHFVNEFISDPKKKKSAEIACVLWILLWIAQEGEGECVTIKQVLQLTSKDLVADDAVIMIDGIERDISWGLKDLLLCLRGKGEGKRAHRLFSSLDLSGKALERALAEVSEKILQKGAVPVLPGAFSVSPHPFKSVRMSVAQRRAMRKIEPVVPLQYTRNNIKKKLLKGKRRHFSDT